MAKGKTREGTKLVFDSQDRVDFVKGFAKRKQERREKAKLQAKEQEREIRRTLKQKKREEREAERGRRAQIEAAALAERSK